MSPKPPRVSEDWAGLTEMARAGQWAAVRQALEERVAAAGSLGLSAHERARFDAEANAWRYRSAPWWWEPVTGGGMVLRRTTADDAGFYKACYANADFARRFNRQAPWRGDLRAALQRAGQDSPGATGSLFWIACTAQGEPRGLVTLTSLDRLNSRAQFSIGSPGSLEPIQACKAMWLAMDFSFFVVGLHKLYAYVYEDNPSALEQALRMGFQLEGTLRDHYFLPGHGFLTVHVAGLTRKQLQQDARACRLARRWLGAQWQPSEAPRPHA
jgi:hypothetical protein